VDTVARTRELLDRGDSLARVVAELRAEDVDMIQSILALIEAAGLDLAAARAAVIDGPVWADQRHRVATRRWIDPPERPDHSARERLRRACAELTRIDELWLAGSEMTRHDRSSTVSTDFALVFDPPAADLSDESEQAETTEMITRLTAAWPTTGPRGWLWISRRAIAENSAHCVAIYARA
jgi:hypothetical protein